MLRFRFLLFALALAETLAMMKEAASPHDALTRADLANQIRDRADLVCQNGEYMGLFELVIYAALRLRPVHACFGSQIVNVCGLFAPWLRAIIDSTIESLPPSGRNVRGPARFVGCVAGGAGKLIASTSENGTFPVMNHWVIGIPIPGIIVDADGGSAPSAAEILDANLVANRVGLLLRPTTTDGNCCADVMAYFDRVPRTRES